MNFPGGVIKNCCVKFVYFQDSNCTWEVNRRKIVCRAILYILLLFVRSFNRSYTWQNKKYVLRLRTAMSIKFTFWKSRRSWYCLIKYPAFASVKTVTLPILVPIVLSLLDGTINAEYTAYGYQHPLHTLMQTSYTYAHACARYESKRPQYHHFCIRSQFWLANTSHLSILSLALYVWIFVCFWMWHSIHRCTYAHFVTRGTLYLRWD